MFGKQRTDVLVIGAGPVGLITALHLRHRGLKVQVVDKTRRTRIHSYALALHPRSLRLLDELGLADELIEQGHKVERVTMMEDGKTRLSLSLNDLPGSFPFVLVVPQRILESTLVAELSRRDVKVRWSQRLQSLDDSPTGVDADLARLIQVPSGYPIARLEWVVGKLLKSHCRYAVGADGYYSFARDQLDVEYRHITPRQTFSVFECESPINPGNEMRIFRHNGMTNVYWPMSGGRCRFSFQINDEAEHEPLLERLNALINERAKWFPNIEADIHWSGLIHFDGRLVENYGKDHIWLAGDAAHLTNPIGVQSLNVGLAEGWELARVIAAQIQGNDPTDTLERYGVTRLREWDRLLGRDGGPHARDDADDWVRKHAKEIVSQIPATGEDLTQLLDQVGLEFGSAERETTTH